MKNLILLLFFLGSILACTSCNDSEQECLLNEELKQAIVWIPQSSDSTVVTEKLKSDSLTRTATCPCNKSLQLWGKDTPIFATTGPDDNNRKPTGGTGDDDMDNLIWSPNYRIYAPNMPDTLSPFRINKEFTPSSGKMNDSILVGIIDSGLEHNLGSIPLWTNQYERPDVDGDRNGLKGDMNGWDFTVLTNTGGTGWDKDESHHGTLVTAFVADELRNFKYKIMPLKVLDGKDKSGSLFNAICAMEYARQQMINHRKSQRIRGILNLSWGYYDLESKPLKVMLERLQSDRIMVVAAAGNQSNKTCDDNAEITTYKRDLSQRKRKFYPASYEGLDNLIVATTITRDTITKGGQLQPAPNQNYSVNLVDVGVLGDNGYYFNVPPLSGGQVWGSSIAAPIATAQVVKAIMAGKNTKNDIFNWLQGNPASQPYLLISSGLNSYIKDGKYTKRRILP